LPEICRFYGIAIAMFYNDHEPPHFHARYGQHKALLAIADAGVRRTLVAAAGVLQEHLALARAAGQGRVVQHLGDPFLVEK